MRAVIVVLLLAIGAGLLACTIGVAAGDVTASGRALLWKTRDIASYPENYLDWNTESEYSFLYVRDLRDSLAWMGVNEKGFCIANSYVEREIDDRPIFNNGSLIFHLLGNCATITEMDAILDTLDISQQILSGNFGVIDSTGAAAMYEISWTEVVKYDAAETHDGYIIRTNFSLISGGSDGIERYNRSQEIISNLAGENSLDTDNLLQEHFRDFSDENSDPVSVPFYDRWNFDRPWGYIKTNTSICRGIAASSAVFEGVLPHEAARTTTMYALLGNPATSVFLPYFPIGMPPHQATSLTGLQLTTRANQIKSLLFNFPENSYYIDSFNLFQPDSIRVFDQILPFDSGMINETHSFLEEWRSGNATIDDAEIYSEYWVNQGMEVLDSLDQYISGELHADFEANIYSGGYPLTVIFSDQTPHYPSSISWDFNNDGIFDAIDMEMPGWVYTSAGVYSVRLLVSNSTSSDEIIRYDYIHVNETSTDDINLMPAPCLIGNFPNPVHAGNNRDNITEILFYLPSPSEKVKIEIFNSRGKKILSQAFDDTLFAGEHRWRWDGIDKKGNIVASGIYLYRLKVPGYKTQAKKMTVIR